MLDVFRLLLCVCVCVCEVASVVSDSLQRYGLQPAMLLCPWDSPGKNSGKQSEVKLREEAIRATGGM